MAILHTNGKGIWTDEKRKVGIHRLTINEKYEGELRAYFTKRSWNVKKHGLVYTDPLFLKELRSLLKKKGLNVNVSYSEQGMQGDTYVSLDYPRISINVRV